MEPAEDVSARDGWTSAAIWNNDKGIQKGNHPTVKSNDLKQQQFVAQAADNGQPC